MNEHEQIMAIIRAKNESQIPLDPHRTALIIVDRRGAGEQVPDDAHDEAPSGECRSNHQGRKIMKRLRTLTLTTMTLMFLGVILPSSDVVAQQKTLKEQVVGTWTYASVDIVGTDGSRVPLYGPNPQGVASFDSNGHYILLTARRGQAKFASNNRNEGTPEENKAVVQGSIAHFGTYTVNDADKTITFHIETSTFPNWNGTEQKRPFTVTRDELKWTTPASSGGSAEVVLKRAK